MGINQNQDRTDRGSHILQMGVLRMTMIQLTDPYKDHSEIHPVDWEYLETVSSTPLEEVPIEDINSFLEGLVRFEYEMAMEEENYA
jgi:hypothetical protein